MNWFGRGWGAAACRPETRVPAPVGEPCLTCGVPITPVDRGVILMSFTVPPSAFDEAAHTLTLGVQGMPKPTHLRCFMRGVVGCGACEACLRDRSPSRCALFAEVERIEREDRTRAGGLS